MKFTDKLPPRKELTKRRDDAITEVERIERERQKCIMRKADAERRLAEIDTQHEQLRKQRQAYMLADQDKEAEGIEKQIVSLEKEEGRVKELQAGLVRVIGECGTFSARQVETRKAAEGQLATLSLYELLDEWNAAAPTLAKIALKIHLKAKELRLSIEDLPGLPRYDRRHLQNVYGGLETLPKFMPGGVLRSDKMTANGVDQYTVGELSFFDIEAYDRDPGLFKEISQ
jgi:hypothetical protein